MDSYVAVIKVWAGLVWADGVVSHREAQAMRRLIDGAELSERERAQALGFLDERVEVEAVGLDNLGAAAREGIYRAAIKLSAVDNDMADEEIEFLARLRDGLGIDRETAERIVDAVAAGK
jgi:uncharacterized tellurite resistance protein B-like protein